MKRKTNATDLVLGLMSGTSCDGIDAALVAVRGHGLHTRVRLVAFETVPYPASVRRLIAQVSDAATGTVNLVCRANVLLGELFAEAAAAVGRAGPVELVPQPADLLWSAHRATHEQIAEVAVDHLHRGPTAAPEPPAEAARTRLHPHDNLPQMGAPGGGQVLVARIECPDLGDLHGS